MRIEKPNTAIERQILTGMIVNDHVLGRIAARWNDNLFRSQWAGLVAQWCVDFFNKYDKAPRADLQAVFEDWAKTHPDSQLIEIVEGFLNSLSRDWEATNHDVNVDLILDLAGKRFNETRLADLVEDVQAHISGGRPDDAIHLVEGFSRINLGVDEAVHLSDRAAIREAFEDNRESLIQYPGDLGGFFGEELCRDALIAFQAPEKRGKTWFLLELAYTAWTQRRRVAFFEVGDMSQKQIMRRMMSRAVGKPITKRQCGKIKIPIGTQEVGDVLRLDYETRDFPEPLDWREGYRKINKIKEKRLKMDKESFKFSVHPNSTINVKGIKSVLEDWENEEGFTPDVIVVDYADILAPENSSLDFRHQVNDTWKALRALSQEKHCLVLSATQANAASYSAGTQSMKHFSEDKRKMAHVTGMIGLNQKPGEKIAGLWRMNWIVLREGEFNSGTIISVAGNLSIGRPIILSSKRIITGEDEKPDDSNA